MNFTLTINGETAAELLATLQQLNVPADLKQPRSEPTAAPIKQQRPAPAKPEKPTQKPAAAPAKKRPEAPTNPTIPASAPDEPQESTPAQTAPSAATVTAPSSEPEKDPATENKIRDLIMALMKQGKQAECKRIITSTGAKGISSLPPESYTAVWGELIKLKDEVDANASD